MRSTGRKRRAGVAQFRGTNLHRQAIYPPSRRIRAFGTTTDAERYDNFVGPNDFRKPFEPRAANLFVRRARRTSRSAKARSLRRPAK